MFVNILHGDDKYSLLNRRQFKTANLDAIISETKNIFVFVSAFLKATLNFERFQTKNATHSLCISEITDSEIRG